MHLILKNRSKSKKGYQKWYPLKQNYMNGRLRFQSGKLREIEGGFQEFRGKFS